jgi:H+/gluconate symporter-like permease
MEASVICMITAGGGSFGNVLKESDIGTLDAYSMIILTRSLLGGFIGDNLSKVQWYCIL